MRNEKKIIILDNEKELTFVCRQMPATKGFRFGVKCAKALARTQSEAINKGGDGTVLDVLLNSIASIDIEMLDEIMDEALSCVTFATPAGVQVCTPDVLDGIIEDPSNVFILLKASIEQNLSFIVRHVPESFLVKLRGGIVEAGNAIMQDSPKDSK